MFGLTRRTTHFAGFAVCVGMLAFALYAEKVMKLEPCPLCMFERVGIALLGIAFLLAALHHPRGTAGARGYAALIGLATLVPAGIATRHVYIQSLPPGTVPSCGATLDYMLEVFPLLEVVRQVMTGGGECAKIDWTLLGLSMPAWVLIAALGLGVVGIAANWRGEQALLRFR